MNRFIIGVLLLSFSLVNAQHCPYDHSALIVIKIRTAENENTLPNLKVSLVKKGKRNAVEDARFRFTQSNRFPFLTDEYSLVIPRSLKTEDYEIRIESFFEFNGKQWMNYGSQTIRLYEIDKFALCGTYKDETYFHNNHDRIYKPIEVILAKIVCK